MTSNKKTVEAYMDGFRTTDRPMILSCLTDDVDWVIPGAFHVRGKDEFAKHIVDEGFAGHPVITVSRLLEVDDVVEQKIWGQSSTFYNLEGNEGSDPNMKGMKGSQHSTTYICFPLSTLLTLLFFCLHFREVFEHLITTVRLITE